MPSAIACSPVSSADDILFTRDGSLWGTTSRPLDPPDTGRIAVKVINLYGDEMLKAYDV